MPGNFNLRQYPKPWPASPRISETSFSSKANKSVCQDKFNSRTNPFCFDLAMHAEETSEIHVPQVDFSPKQLYIYLETNDERKKEN